MGRRGALVGLVVVVSLGLGVVPAAVAAPGPTSALSAVAAAASSGFSDVPQGHPFETEISWLAGVGVTTGYADGTFHPVEVVSRQAMAAFLYRYAGRPAYAQPESPRFTDVPIDHPFYTEIAWFAEQGITAGYADGTFHPEESVSRQAMAAFVYRFAHRPAFTAGEVARFSDVPIDSGFVREIEWLASSGITTGYADGTFHPVEDVSRQAMAAFVYRLDTNPAIGQEPVAPGPVTSVQVVGVGTSSVDLAWANPDGAGFTGAVVRRAQGSTPPASPSDGDLGVATAGWVNRWTDTGLVAGEVYSYAVFAQYADGTEVAGATVTVEVPAVASITGTVTGTGGVAVPGVVAEVVGPDGGQSLATTSQDGTWQVAGLAAGDYEVCFVPAGVTAGASTGYLSQCFDQVLPGGDPSPVTVVDGAETTGVDAALAAAGAVSGMVTDVEGTPLAGVTVSVDPPGGRPVATVMTDANGRWIATGLDAGTYGVCFDPSADEGTVRYTAQCYNALTPTQVPTPITVTTGATTTDIDARLAAAGPVGAAAATLGADRVASDPAAAVVAESSRAAAATAMPAIASSDLGAVGCADVLFLGARGSDEPGPGGAKQNPNDTTGGLGDRVITAYRAFAQEIDADRLVQPVSVTYPADGLARLLKGDYIEHLWDGVEETRRALTARATVCPDERLVLAGYSQGAMVMHRVLSNATTAGVASMSHAILARVDAAVLIADGDRVAYDFTRDSGTADDSSWGVGSLLDNTIRPARLGTDIGFRTYSVCDEADSVCDAAPRSLLNPSALVNPYGWGVHMTHYVDSVAVKHAAATAAGRLRFPPPLSFATPGELPQAVVGLPYHVTFSASGGMPPYTYALASPVPEPGLSHWADGRWYGTPTVAGRYFMSVRVTDAMGRRATQAFSLPVLGSDASWRSRRVTEGWDGGAANGGSGAPSISQDGRWIAYHSSASNLVAGDTNGKTDVFVTDQTTGRSMRVSRGLFGIESDGDSMSAAMSADGRWVAYTSYASNLVSGDTNGVADLFVTDRVTGLTARVSESSAGIQADEASWGPALSADGRWIAYGSRASNLVADDTNGAADIFVWDRTTGETTRASIGADGTQGDGDSLGAAVSADGRWIAFSTLRGLWPGDPDEGSDVFLKDRVTGQRARVSQASDGTPADRTSGCARISADGNLVAYSSTATALVPGDTNGAEDVFAWNRTTGETTRVSIAPDGTQGEAASVCPSGISADGRWISYMSYAENLAPGAGSMGNILVTDRVTGRIAPVSRSLDGAPTNSAHGGAAMSEDGRWIAYASSATNILPGGLLYADSIFIAENPLGP